MRSLIVSCNVTVDGYMAGPGGDLASLGFIVADQEQEDALAARFGEVADTIVFGRRTFRDMEGYWTKVDNPMATWINATPKVVLSTDAALDVRSWKSTSLVVFGGVQTIRSLIAADLVDEYWLKISPVVVGEGSSMFAELPDHRSLTLGAAKGYPSGLLDVTYAKQRA